MAEPTWYGAVETVTPHVVRVLTPRGSGTGFLFHRSKNGDLVGLATAAHVIDDSHYWGEPIRVHHAPSGDPLLLRETERALFLDATKDTAAILMAAAALKLPPQPLPLLTKGKRLKVGNEVGWLGFPAIPRADLCFFQGSVSAYIKDEAAYLVDGVVINGVSGGPAFYFPKTPIIMGILSAYVPNRATGEALPGLSVVRDVSHLHELLQDFKSIEDAKREETPPSAPPAPPGAAPKPAALTRRSDK